ncbi:MAG: hypothetical protein EBY32_18165 [Proteobacteria bacterium]|nr:hypothetical protein [Pseudomonadota bacterium]
MLQEKQKRLFKKQIIAHQIIKLKIRYVDVIIQNIIQIYQKNNQIIQNQKQIIQQCLKVNILFKKIIHVLIKM